MDESDTINISEFDSNFKNIFILKNSEIFERRSIGDVNTVTLSIELNQRATSKVSKQLTVSKDGTWCAVGGGDSSTTYLVDLENKMQHTLLSETLD